LGELQDENHMKKVTLEMKDIVERAPCVRIVVASNF